MNEKFDVLRKFVHSSRVLWMSPASFFERIHPNRLDRVLAPAGVIGFFLTAIALIAVTSDRINLEMKAYLHISTLYGITSSGCFEAVPEGVTSPKCGELPSLHSSTWEPGKGETQEMGLDLTPIADFPVIGTLVNMIINIFTVMILGSLCAAIFLSCLFYLVCLKQQPLKVRFLDCFTYGMYAGFIAAIWFGAASFLVAAYVRLAFPDDAAWKTMAESLPLNVACAGFFVMSYVAAVRLIRFTKSCHLVYAIGLPTWGVFSVIGIATVHMPLARKVFCWIVDGLAWLTGLLSVPFLLVAHVLRSGVRWLRVP